MFYFPFFPPRPSATRSIQSMFEHNQSRFTVQCLQNTLKNSDSAFCSCVDKNSIPSKNKKKCFQTKKWCVFLIFQVGAGPKHSFDCLVVRTEATRFHSFCNKGNKRGTLIGLGQTSWWSTCGTFFHWRLSCFDSFLFCFFLATKGI